MMRWMRGRMDGRELGDLLAVDWGWGMRMWWDCEIDGRTCTREL
jgi:hypothetical protein